VLAFDGRIGMLRCQMDARARGGRSMIVGSGQFKYRVNADWAKLPDGWSFKEVGGVGVDGKDKVYVFSRGEHPMMVFDRQGNFLRSWGEGQYPRAHGVHMASFPCAPRGRQRRTPISTDSLLEGDGFELSVPLAKERRFRPLITRNSLTTTPSAFQIGGNSIRSQGIT
jgi:hypothetical protein